MKYIKTWQVIRLIRNSDFYGLGIFLLLVVLIGYQEMISPAIGIFILVVLTEGFFFKSLRFVYNPGLVLFIGLYIFYLLGLLWSEHPEIGWKLMEYKMSFFIFPVLFLFPKATTAYRVCLQGLVWGCVVLALRFLWVKYTTGTGLSYYDISRTHLNLHPTYVAVYYALAIVFLCWNMRKEIKKEYKIFVSLLCLVFACFILATGSFAGILFLGILLATGLGYLILFYLNRLALVIYILLAPVLIYLALTQIRSLAYDLEMVSQIKTEIKEGKEAFLEKNKMQISGTRERVMLWYVSAEIIAENPFGVGTGDIDFYLQNKCEKYDLQLLKQQNLNPHNQFLQIGIDLGWSGICYFIFILAWFFIKGIFSKNMLLVLTILSLGFNALFESVLQRQSGIVFYTLVICLLLVMISLTNKETKENWVFQDFRMRIHT